MSRILLIILPLLYVFHGIAQDVITIKGQLITADGSPAKGIYLFVKNSKSTTYSNDEGYFDIKVKPGRITLLIHANLQTNEKEINIHVVNDTLLAPIPLKIASKALKQVVITGQQRPQILQKSIFNIRSITQEKIRQSAATTIQQVLMTEPGIRFNTDLTLGTADIELNGMSGRNVKILVDGIPMLDRSDARESLNQIDINLVERIEIVEGPMSVIYGSDALAGVINIITKSNKMQTMSISAKVQEESVGEEYNFWNGKGNHHKNVAMNWATNRFFTTVGITNNDFGGWNLPPENAFIAEVNATTAKWKPKKQWMENIQFGYKKANFSASYRLMAIQEAIDTRYGINPNNYMAKFQTFNTQRWNHQLQSSWIMNPNNLFNITINITDLSRKTNTTIYDYNTNTSVASSDQGEQDKADFTSLILRATSQHQLSTNLSIQPGIEYNNESARGARIKGNPSINDYALFVSAEYNPFSYWSIRPGARYIKNSVYQAPHFIPSINTKIDLYPNIDLRLSYAKGYRAPALRELYFDFIDASHSIIGNENLRAEHANSFNAAVNWRAIKAGKWEFISILSGFYTIFKDRIDYAYDVNDPTITTLMNIDQYKTTGIILNNTIRHTNFQTTVGISYLGRFNKLSENIHTINPFSWTPEIFGDFTYTLKKCHTTVSLFLKKTGKRISYQTNNGDSENISLAQFTGYTWADLMINKKFKKNLDFNLGVKNLFNVTHQSASGNNPTGAHTSSSTINTSYGRSFVIGLAYHLNITKN